MSYESSEVSVLAEQVNPWLSAEPPHVRAAVAEKMRAVRAGTAPTAGDVDAEPEAPPAVELFLQLISRAMFVVHQHAHLAVKAVVS